MTARYKLALLLLISLAAFFWGNSCTQDNAPLARVNEQMIFRQDLDRFINLMRLCNPELDSVINAHADESETRKIELEFLHILIDVELVDQETRRLSLPVQADEVNRKTDTLVENLISTHYGNSPDQFHQRRKQLEVSAHDLRLIPQYELQLQALFDYTAASLTEEDLVQFVEENPDLCRQEASVEVRRISFFEEEQARAALELLRQGKTIENYLDDVRKHDPRLEVEELGWVSRDNPFYDLEVKELLFSATQNSGGGIIKSGDRYHLYWIIDRKPAAVLKYEDVKEQALLRKQYVLYQDYFNALLSESDIEILH